MPTSEDAKFFDAINTTLIAPIFFFLSFVLGAVTVACVWHAREYPNYLVIGCLMFVLGYNAFRFAKKMKGVR
jgi:uncharacterized membrane protein